MKKPALARKHLDQRLGPMRQSEGLARPPRGWLRAIRDALGMTTAQLAKRIHVDQSRITRLEQAEAEGSVTLKTLRQAAEGLNCTLVYALVPNQPLDEMMRERADDIADRQLARTHHTMKLENQALDQRGLKAERERLIEELVKGNPRRLWDEP
jgi:predicted DNA-binding mobile mystery protein A